MSTPRDSADKHDGPTCCPARQAFRRRLALSIDWIDDRTGLRSAVRWFADRPVARGIPWDSLGPSMIAFVFVVQAITGFFLWIHYSPSAQTAWESVYYLQYQVAGGWLLRGVHHYAAQVLVALTGLYLIYLIVRGMYRAPRECVYWVAVLMGLASLGLCLTGDLLAWDQNSYASTLVRVRFLMLVPGIGDDLFKLAAGGPAFGHLTLTRFVALHIGLFAAGFFGLLLLHSWLVHRAASKVDETAKETPPPDARYWPDRLVYHAAAWLAVMAIVGLLIGRHVLWGHHTGELPGDYLGGPLGAPADPDPANFYAAARPEWSFRGLYQLSHAFPGDAIPLLGMSWKIVPIFVIPSALVLLVLLLPFIDRLRRGHGINLSVLGFLVAAVVLLSAASWWHDLTDPEHHAALAEGRRQAERVKQLVRGQGIPSNGALWLLRNDPKTQGPRIYRRLCLACHDYGAPGEEAIAAESPSAPDLYGFAGREWLAGFFDAHKIKSPRYYGNTKFATGVMVRYVEGPFSELDPEEQTAIIAALSAEARLPSQTGLDRADQTVIEEGRERIAAECTRCHRFGDQGPRGYAPDLTGYGSQEWIIGVVMDPTHDWFYGRRNDRMPAYLEAPDEPEKNRLAADAIGLVADWLRGEWYEPREPSAGEAARAEVAEIAKHASPMLTAGKWLARRAKPVAIADTPLAQARALFNREHCAICHDLTGMPGGDIKASDPSAPDLGGFATRRWIAGLLDPERIRTRKYFGNSRFRRGEMAGFVRDMFSDLDDEEKREIETLVIALSAEAQLPAQLELDQQDAERIEKGRSLLSDWGCTDCHRFHGSGDHVGPDLTGYGSVEWLTGFLCDPAKGESHDPNELCFYGDGNYGMPSYRRFRPEQVEGDGPEAAQARKKFAHMEGRNLLSADQIRQLVSLLRGELAGSVD